MYDAKDIIEILSKLDTGDGLFRGDPLFLLSDGSIIDKNGNQVARPSQLGDDKYDAFVGFAKNANPTATARGGVLADAKGEGDTIPCKIGTDGKLYVASDAESAFRVDVDEVAAVKPGVRVTVGRTAQTELLDTIVAVLVRAPVRANLEKHRAICMLAAAEALGVAVPLAVMAPDITVVAAAELPSRETVNPV